MPPPPFIAAPLRMLAALCLSATAFAQSPTITLEIPIEAASHSFQFYDDYQSGNGPALMFGGTPVYDYLTQKFLVVGTPPYGYNSYVMPRLLDETTGLSLDYGAFYITDSMSYFPTLSGGGTFSYALDESRVNHTFALVSPSQGYAFPVTKLPIQGMDLIDSDGNPVFFSLGFFNAFANTQIATLDFTSTVLVDLTAQKQSAITSPDLRAASAWLPRTVQLPSGVATFTFGEFNYYAMGTLDTAQTYTLHTSSGALQSVSPYEHSYYDQNWNWHNEARISGQVGIFEEYWLTKNGTGESTPHYYMGLGGAEVVQSAAPLQVPVVQPSNYQTVTFEIGENHFSENLYVVDDNGSTTSGLSFSGGINALVTWDHAGTEVIYQYGYYSAIVEMNKPWTLSNGSTNYGQTTQLLDGFTPYNPVPPAGNVAISVPHSRFAALSAGQIKLRNGAQNAEWTVSLTDSTTNSYWMGFDLGTADEYWLTVQYNSASAPSATLSPSDTVELVDLSNGDTRSFSVDSLGFDPAAWAPAITVNITLPAQRWISDLIVRTPHGTGSYIERGAMQGLWSNGYFNSYGTYSATTTILAGVPWWIENLNTGEIAHSDVYFGDFSSWIGVSPSPDIDEDGLPDWYEYILGTSDENWDSDGDEIDDYAEAAAGTNPNQAKPILTVTAPVGAVWLN